MSKAMIRLASKALNRIKLLFKQSYLFIPPIRGECINIGCDKGIRRGWINIDSEIVNPSIISVDIKTASGLHELYQMSARIIEINHVINRLDWKQASSLLDACFLVLKRCGKVIINFTDESKRVENEGQADIENANNKNYSDFEFDLYPSSISGQSRVNMDEQTGSTTWTAKKLTNILVSLGFSTICIEKLPKHDCAKSLDACIIAYKKSLH